MNGLVATSPPAQPDQLIQNDGWFPEVAMADARQLERVSHAVTGERLRHALLVAMLDINGRLADWQSAQLAAGHASMAAAMPLLIDNKPKGEQLYLRAVMCLAHASLADRYVDFDASGHHADKQSEVQQISDGLRRDASWAVSDILGLSRTTVELI